jgi:hypothetical protein
LIVAPLAKSCSTACFAGALIVLLRLVEFRSHPAGIGPRLKRLSSA